MKALLVIIAIFSALPALASSPPRCPPTWEVCGPGVPNPPPNVITNVTNITEAGSAVALAGVELPTVQKGETSWAAGVTFDGGFGLGIQHGISDSISIYVKAGKADGEGAVGTIGIAGKF